MSNLLIIGAVQALFLSFLILTKKKKVLADFWLTGFLVLLFLVFSTTFLSLEPGNEGLRFYLIDISLLIAPFFFIYIVTLIDEKRRFRKIYLFHFIPYVLSTLYYEHLASGMADQAFVDLFNKVNFLDRPFLFNVFFVLELLIIPIYIFWIVLLLKGYRKTILSKFSSLERIDLQWIQYLLIALFGIWAVINLSMLLSDQLKLISEEEALKYGFGLAVIFIFYLSYYGFKQSDTFAEVKFYESKIEREPADGTKPQKPAPKYMKSGLKEEEAARIYMELITLMDTEKPFLNNQLSIVDLAQQMNVSTHNLSQVLNGKSKQSFYDFVNGYRVEEFKQLIRDPKYQNYTLLGLALDCGFNSKASFNRIFKKFTDQTPSQYFQGVKTARSM